MIANSPMVDRKRLTELLELERRTFSERNPRSRALFDQSKRTLLNGVPMSWMSCWPGGYPVFAANAKDATITDVDGHAYVDFCLGDTGAFAGHAADATADAVRAQFARGATTMLPTEDAAWVGAELARRFGLPVWQFSLSATDANRWVLRLTRELTGRAKVLVFNGCYHGTVDETVIELDKAGRPGARPGNAGAAFDPTRTTEVIEFNDILALERVLQARAIACVLTEPALTNAAGIIPPQPGYHEALRELTARTGTYLALDETQTFPAGPGGYTGEHGLSPDFLTVGKAIAGGIPLGAYGMRRGRGLLVTGIQRYAVAHPNDQVHIDPALLVDEFDVPAGHLHGQRAGDRASPVLPSVKDKTRRSLSDGGRAALLPRRPRCRDRPLRFSRLRPPRQHGNGCRRGS